MLPKILLLCCMLQFIQSQNSCYNYWQFIREGEEVQGYITLPADNVSEQKLTIQLTIIGQISTVSPNSKSHNRTLFFVHFEMLIEPVIH